MAIKSLNSTQIRQLAALHYVLDGSREPDEPQDFGEDMFDPSGFVPLEVMIQQQRIAGKKALLQRSMFDFEDWNEIYMETERPDFDNDFEVMEYIREIERKKSELLAKRQKEISEEFAEFMASKRKKDATTTTTINDDDDDAKMSSNQTQSHVSDNNVPDPNTAV